MAARRSKQTVTGPPAPPAEAEPSPAALFFRRAVEASPEEVTELGFTVEATVRQQLEARGHYTADRVPEPLRRVIVKLLGAGLGKQTIAELVGCAWETVRAVDVAHASSIRDQKESIAHRLRLIIDAGTEDMLGRIRAGALKVSPLELGILIDKWLLLSGEATARVEVGEDPRIAAFRELAAQIGSAGAEKSAKGTVVDVPGAQPSAALPPGDVVAECHPFASVAAPHATADATTANARPPSPPAAAAAGDPPVADPGGGSRPPA